ncbi:hypothetical protein [Variovorax sp. RO1]|uniref:hypothetical protein n=1 Tax=Variovorax sp. RO1 TaxID=2066034 RepID=UPI00117BEDFE|nr:hypothetical protein [Variovorax sp. RO1]
MRQIVKNAEPRGLLEWKKVNLKTPENLTYSGGGFPRKDVLASLLNEQYHLCAYTMRRIPSDADCHIEHYLPQSRNISWETIDYSNMLACYPGGRAKTICEYGAHLKKNFDPDGRDFCSPLHPATPASFVFHEDGRIEGRTVAGENTIKILDLNHATLKNDRRATINGFIWPRRHKGLSAAEAKRLAARVKQPDAMGRLEAFCEAVAQVAIKYSERLERRASRLKIQSQK